jgi:hypothetical protein
MASRTTPPGAAAHTDLTHAPGVSVQNAWRSAPCSWLWRARVRSADRDRADSNRTDVRRADGNPADGNPAEVRRAGAWQAFLRGAVGCVTDIVALDPRASSLSRRACTAHLPWRLRGVWHRALGSDQTSPQARMTARQDGEVLACMAPGLSIDRTPAARGPPFPKNAGFTNPWCGTILRPRSPFNSISRG